MSKSKATAPEHRPIVTEEFLRKQLRRIAQMLPQDRTARQEYVRALGAAAYDDDHARRIVDSVLDSDYATRLMPHDLRRIGYTTRDEEAGQSWGCEECDGTGWRRVRNKQNISAVEPCSCKSAV